MNFARLTLIFLFHKPLFTVITILLIIIPIAILNSVMIFDIQARKFFNRSTATVDLILGASGDPSELARGALLHHGDFSGSIPVKETRELVKNRVVKLAVPVLAVDQYQGHVITGTNINYPVLFNASLLKGRWWQDNMEVVLGYGTARKTRLKVGDTFFADHGLHQTGNMHGAMAFRVTGILKKNSQALDDIILTSVESIWLLHDPVSLGPFTDYPANVQKMPNDYFPFDFPENDNGELSAVLIQLRSPVTAESFLPHNGLSPGFQVISPVAEFFRLYRSAHFSLSALTWFGFTLLVVGLMLLFVRLFYFIEEKSKDMFLLRTLGGTGMLNTRLMILQGLIIADIAAMLGFILSHAINGIAGSYSEVSKVYGTTGAVIYWQEVALYIVVIILALIVSLFPAWRAGRLNFWDISSDPVL